MKEKKTENNEDEKVSIWDYVDKGDVVFLILLSLLIMAIVIAIYFTVTSPPPPPPTNGIPHMHP